MPPYTRAAHSHIDLPPDQTQNHNQDLDPNANELYISSVERQQLGNLHRQVTESIAPTNAASGLRSFLRESDCCLKWYAPHRGVVYESLSTYGQSRSQNTVKTVATAAWRTVTFQDILETIWPNGPLASPKQPQPIIRDFSGVVNNGEMLLVLGNPGSGCSTFLRTLGNSHEPFSSVEGHLSYSGVSAATIRAAHRGHVAYVPEDDAHFPTLTVRQTLEFALRSKLPKRYHDEIPAHLDVYGKVFGMSHVMDTMVGNEYIRGISGGEKKRVSIMESFAVDSSIIAWDNSTRGLDASSALKFAKSLRILTDETGKATIVTLYQTSDDALMLMDKLILMDEGRMLYQGPASEAKAYFEDLGYLHDDRQRICDFLTSITSPNQRRFRPGFEKSAPKGAIELEATFRRSRQYANVMKEVQEFKCFYDDKEDSDQEQQPFKATLPARKSRFEPTSTSYNTSAASQLRISLQREWWQLKQHMFPLYVRLASVIINALLIGSMFYAQPLDTTGMYSRGGFVFYAVITIGWIQLAELEGALDGRRIIARHKKQAMVRPSLVGLAKVVFDLVICLLACLAFAPITYFLGGLKMKAGPFLIFFLVLYLETFCFTQIYRLFAAVSPSFELALRYCGVVLLACILFGGYLMPLQLLLDDVPWVGWIAYATPLLYGYEAIMATEFAGTMFSCVEADVVPRGANYSDYAQQTCAYPGSVSGQLGVLGDNYISANYGFSVNHVWRNIGILIAMTVGILLLTLWLLEVIDWSHQDAGVGGTQFTNIPKVQMTKPGDLEKQEVSDSDRSDEPDLKEARALPLKPTSSIFTWKDLTYDVPTGSSEKRLLDNISGYCKPGEMTALVGASGAGKTTLLTALSLRHKSGKLAGQVRVNGQPLNQSFPRSIGFCTQVDIHDDTSTVYEAFLFSARLRQKSNVPDGEKVQYAEDMLATLGLQKYANAIIGSLSLESKRRTSIGVELCAKPSLLVFLDEPTSGLDSMGALSIVQLLRRLADSGQAILCTIHQASHEQIALFDRVLALQAGGKVFYNGTVGPSGSDIFAYFAQHGIIAPTNTNVADFVIDIGTGTIPSEHDWSSVWRSSAAASAVQATIQRAASSPTAVIPTSNPRTKEYSTPPLTQTRHLILRNSRQFYRLAEYTYARLYASTVHALLNGLTFLQLGNSLSDLQAVTFSIFLVLMLVPEFINGISMRFIANRNVWLEKDYPARVYGAFAFATAQIVAELPYALVGGVVFYLLFYFMVGLPLLGLQAGYTFGMIVLFHLFATSWGQWIAALSPDALVAANLMPFFVILCELFNGILRPAAGMPVFWRYTMYYLAPFTYWIGGTLSVVLQGRPVVCTAAELTYFPLPAGGNGTAPTSCGAFAASFLAEAKGYIANPGESAAGAMCGYCPASVGDDFLDKYGLSTANAWRDFGIFFGFVLSNYALVYLFVYMRLPKAKKIAGL